MIWESGELCIGLIILPAKKTTTWRGLAILFIVAASFFLAGDGEVVHVQVGQLTDEQIGRYSERLVAGEEILP